MPRLITAVMLILFPSLGWSADFCSGQYKNVGELVHAALRKYDSLYSGGDHWHAIDDVGATVDLYRLWRNLPDWHLRELNHAGLLKYDIFPQDTPSVDQMQWVAEQVNDGNLQPQQKYEAIVGLDLAGRITTPADAWLDDAADYSPQWLWLQLVMTASDAPWAIAPHLAQENDARLSGYVRLRDVAWRHYEEGGGIEWAVAAQTLTQTGEADLRADRLFQNWQAKVESCKATQGEYAAWAISAPLRWASKDMSEQQIANLALPFKHLPIASQRMVIHNLAWAALLEGLRADSVGRSAPRLSAIAALADSSATYIAPWVNVARTYQASTLEELMNIHQNHPVEAKSARAFNLLSAADMARLAEAPGLSTEMRKAMVMTAFTRNVALGNAEQASRLLPELQQLVPEHAQDIEMRLQQNLPQQIRLDLIVLDNPQLSTWLVVADENDDDAGIWLRNSQPRRDLPRELAFTIAVQQDLETWLLLPQKWDRFFGLHGITLNALDRIHASRARTTPTAVPAPALFKVSPGLSDRYFEHLVAWSELPRLVEGNGLSHVISRDIVEWVESESDNWLKRLFVDQELMAQALSQVVRLNRRADGGLLGQVPSGQAAFTLLHRRFPKSEAARQTPHWFHWTGGALQEP
ncbi:hypothetical protein [Pseudomonas sp. SCB32]|uniref:hypothetical protein n=1 Tax=Pseudomonas sp. SCB32 TaxID=2653853 RepID=UPI001264F51E|nr:hypothetical protein [Pseudomonas sp. SCB32]